MWFRHIEFTESHEDALSALADHELSNGETS